MTLLQQQLLQLLAHPPCPWRSSHPTALLLLAHHLMAMGSRCCCWKLRPSWRP